jgi:hypothetical protein
VGGWLEELELKQALQFSIGLGLCKILMNILPKIAGYEENGAMVYE